MLMQMATTVGVGWEKNFASTARLV